jgi:uncharacterized coiled-coil protein SlyX
MPERRPMRERLQRIRSVLGLLAGAMVVAGTPVLAQTRTVDTTSRLQQLDALVTAQQATIEQLKKEYALSSQIDRVSAQVEALKKQLDTLEATNKAAKGTAVPAAAWWTLTIVGSLFVVSWGITSWRRESTAQTQADASIQLAESDLQKTKAIHEGATERVRRIAELIRLETPGMGADQKVEWLKAICAIDRPVAGT